jgi:hypothetical protein
MLAADPQLIEQLTGGSDGALAGAAGGGAASGWQVSEAELLAAVRCCAQAYQAQAVTSSSSGGSTASMWEDEDALSAASQALCSHFGVAKVEQLGCGGLGRLLRSCLEAGEQQVAAVLQPAAALACGHSQQVQQAGIRGTGSSAGGGQQEVQLALAALAAAPELAPLHSWLNWPGSFQARCGPLPAFVLQHSSHLQAADLSFLQLPGGDCIKVPTSCNIDSFRAAVTAQDAAAAVGQVLGLVAQHGSVGAAPTAELRHITATCLVAMAGQDR